jgi:hypothetical protein
MQMRQDCDKRETDADRGTADGCLQLLHRNRLTLQKQLTQLVVDLRHLVCQRAMRQMLRSICSETHGRASRRRLPAGHATAGGRLERARDS